MGDEDLTSLDEMRPDGAVDQILTLDEAEHDTRRKLKAWADVEHSLLDGGHTFTVSPTTPATPVGWQLWFNTDTNELLVYAKLGPGVTKWVTVEQAPYNYLYNSTFSRFLNVNTIPMGWSYYGSSTTGTVAVAGSGLPDPHQKFGPYAMVINSGNGDLNAFQCIGKVGSTFAPAAYWLGRTVSLGCWVWSATANKVRLLIDCDGASFNSASDYHPGDGTWRWLVAVVKVPTAPAVFNFLTATFRVEGPGINAVFSCPTFVEGSWCVHVLPSGNLLRSSLIHLGSPSGALDSVAGGTVFYGPHGANTSVALAGTPVPFQGLVSNMRVYITNGAGSGKTYTNTLMVNGFASLMTCTIVDLNTFNVDNTNKVLVMAGDMLSLSVTGTVGANVSAVRSSFLFEEVPFGTT